MLIVNHIDTRKMPLTRKQEDTDKEILWLDNLNDFLLLSHPSLLIFYFVYSLFIFILVYFVYSLQTHLKSRVCFDIMIYVLILLCF